MGGTYASETDISLSEGVILLSFMLPNSSKLVYESTREEGSVTDMQRKFAYCASRGGLSVRELSCLFYSLGDEPCDFIRCSAVVAEDR